jgi:hypothetical protein
VVALLKSASKSNSKRIEARKIQEEAKPSVSAADESETPKEVACLIMKETISFVHCVASPSRKETVSFLIARSADVNAKDDEMQSFPL